MPELNTITDPQSRRFVERLSCVLVVFSAFGALYVLIDPVLSFKLANGNTFSLGGNGFADQMKGAVLMLILIAGFTAVVNYWLGASNTGDKAQESVNAIATAAAPMTGTGNGSTIDTPRVDIKTDTATITPAAPTERNES